MSWGNADTGTGPAANVPSPTGEMRTAEPSDSTYRLPSEDQSAPDPYRSLEDTAPLYTDSPDASVMTSDPPTMSAV